ncbi:F0F1 ATP synthase subunit A [Bacteriovoracaceae bacterium]|nr:F0F1 ATP synthase subunit A [Bacteriovoracaceae bacterium]
MKLILSVLAMLASSSVLASGGFTWMSHLAHATHLPEHTVTMAAVGILFLLVGFIYRSKLASVSSAIIPDRGISFRNIFETIGEFIYNLCVSIMGEKNTKNYYGMVIVCFCFIFMNNVIGLVPGFLPPTENFNTSLAFGLFVFLYYNWQGIRVQGLVGHLKHFAGPVWYLAPLIFILELISHGVRPVSLGLRLQGNMQGDHLVLSIFSDLVPLIIPIPFYVVGLFVCFMQAFVFTILTMVYISMATETHDHEDHAH